MPVLESIGRYKLEFLRVAIFLIFSEIIPY